MLRGTGLAQGGGDERARGGSGHGRPVCEAGAGFVVAVLPLRLLGEVGGAVQRHGVRGRPRGRGVRQRGRRRQRPRGVRGAVLDVARVAELGRHPQDPARLPLGVARALQVTAPAAQDLVVPARGARQDRAERPVQPRGSVLAVLLRGVRGAAAGAGLPAPPLRGAEKLLPEGRPVGLPVPGRVGGGAVAGADDLLQLRRDGSHADHRSKPLPRDPQVLLVKKDKVHRGLVLRAEAAGRPGAHLPKVRFLQHRERHALRQGSVHQLVRVRDSVMLQPEPQCAADAVRGQVGVLPFLLHLVQEVKHPVARHLTSQIGEVQLMGVASSSPTA
mmetsp:Transcript_38268/g.110531  ORF Transcript_38268/g.110531 Transcript_38268/m.110531 type:complete len:330 (-) Transcript_38268:752-1741(-)